MNATPSGQAGGPEPPVEEGPTFYVCTAVPAGDGLLTTGAKRSAIGTMVAGAYVRRDGVPGRHVGTITMPRAGT
jgi:hypothetical protein